MKAIVFKQEFVPHNGWLNYGLVIVILLVIVLVLAKKHKPRSTLQAGCQLIEKKHLSNKTVMYIVEYQQQQFLLADNQQSLAIHPLENRLCERSVGVPLVGTLLDGGKVPTRGTPTVRQPKEATDAPV